MRRQRAFFPTVQCEKTHVLVDQLEKYEQQLQNQMNAIDVYLHNNYDNLDALEDPDLAEEYVSSPINTFKMIQRLYQRVGNIAHEFKAGGPCPAYIIGSKL